MRFFELNGKSCNKKVSDLLAIAPLNADWRLAGDPELPFEFEPGLTLERIPEWLRTAETLAPLNARIRDQIKTWATHALLSRYQEDTEEIPEAAPRKGTQYAANERLLLANQALWLARRSGCRYEAIIYLQQEPVGTWRYLRSGTLRDVGVREDERFARHTPSDLDAAKELYLSMRALERGGAVWLARSTLWAALTADRIQIRFLLTWIALEALFAPREGDAITHQIAERIALFLRESPADRRELYRDVKHAYRLRSQVAHGREVKAREPDELVVLSERLARDALLKILQTRELTRSFEDAREEHLLGLVLARD